MDDNHPANDYPNLPEFGDPRWQEAAVAPRKQRSTQLRPAPRTTMSTGQATVFAGDIIHIVPDILYEDWVAARVGRKLGWLNTDDVDFIDPNTPKPKAEEFTRPLGETESYHHLITKELDSDEAEAAPTQASRPVQPDHGSNGKKASMPDAPLSVEDIPVNLTIGEIDALLENLKGIAMTLQQARTRAKREAKAAHPAPKKAVKKRAKKQS